jgi:hypothetical protein
MNDHITGPVRRLAARATGPIARRLLGRLQAGDTFVRQAGWAITPTRFGGRTYRDPRFGQFGAARTPGSPEEPASLPAPGALPAPGTSPPPAPAGQIGPQGGADDRQHR